MVLDVLVAFVGNVLVLSAIAKSVRHSEYFEALQGYSLLQRAPQRFVLLAARLVAPCELAAAILIFIPRTAEYGAVLAALLFLAFYLLLGADKRPIIANCGCWGVTTIPAPRRAFVFRNAGLTVVALACLTLLLAEGVPRDALEIIVSIGMTLPFAALALEIPGLTQVATLRRVPSSSH